MTLIQLNERFLCLFLIFSFSTSFLLAKPSENRLPLTKALDQISEVYQVIFTYDASTLADISVDFELEKGEALESVVNKVLKSTGLKYRYVGEKYYIIYKDTKTGNKKARKISRNIKKIQKLENSHEIVLQRQHNPQNKVQNLRNIIRTGAVLKAEKSISGVVTNEAGEPLIGVTVLVKNTTVGTATDISGRFELSVPDDAQTLIFSYTGYNTTEVEIGNRTIFNVTLSGDVAVLDEVVVIGFGEKKRKDLTGSIASIDAKTIEKTQMMSPQFALQGNTPGVRVVNTNGDPNAEPQVQIRGIGTWNGRSQPLYVIDGQIINEAQDFGNQDVIAGAGRQTRLNLWNLINPQDIESISVLKDASAAAIYGARAANGVVLITTKKGKQGKPVVEFSSSIGWSTVPTEDRLLNTQQWVELNREAHNNSTDPNAGIDVLYGRDILPVDDTPEAAQVAEFEKLTTRNPQMDPQSPYYINESTAQTFDYQDHLLRTGRDANYNIKVSGASESTNYYVSLGYRDYEHPHVGNDIERYTGAINLNTDISRWLGVGLNYKFASSQNRVDEVPFEDVVRSLPWQPIFSDDPNNSTDGFAHVIDPPDGMWVPLRRFGQGGPSNELAIMNYNLARFETMRNMAQGYVEIKPLPGLKLRGTYNIDQTVQNRFTRNQYFTAIFSPVGQNPAEQSNSGDPNALGSIGNRRNWFTNYQADLTLSYERTFGKHRASILIGGQDTYIKQRFESSSGSNVQPQWNPNDLDQTGYSNDLANNSSILGFGDYFSFGYVARGSYNYDSKYYIDLSFRRDGSSGFADDFQWGNFYSVAAAWRISSEPFMEGVAFINDLKIRGGYGEAGNDEAARNNFAFLSTVSNIGSVRFGSGSGNSLGNYSIANFLRELPNPQLSWETGVTQYIGLDALMMNNRLSLTAEVYRRTTQDILQRVSLAPSLGVADPLINVGELENRGIDLDLGWSERRGDFEFGIAIKASFLENEVTKLYQNQPIFATDRFGGDARRIELGRSIGHIWGYQVAGIFQSQEEVNNYIEGKGPTGVNANQDVFVNPAFIGPGDIYFANVGGNPTDDEPFYSTTPDTVLNAFDQTEIGNTLPNFTYGLNLNAAWRGLDFSVSFYGESGAERINDYRRILETLAGGGGSNKLNTTLDRWTPSNPSTTMPRAVAGDPAGNNRRNSSRWVENANFLRLNNWQLGYSLPASLLDRTKGAISNLRIYIAGQNNLLITNWTGIDPVNDRYPIPRTYLVGLSAKF